MVEVEMASSLAKETITHDEFIVTTAQAFELKRIKPRDALHLACAVKGKAEYFLTCDNKLIGKASGLEVNFKIINPIKFIEYMEVN